MPKTLKVDQDACIGCGACVGSYSDVFAFNDDGKSEVVADIDDSLADEAIACCPVAAISE